MDFAQFSKKSPQTFTKKEMEPIDLQIKTLKKSKRVRVPKPKPRFTNAERVALEWVLNQARNAYKYYIKKFPHGASVGHITIVEEMLK